MAELSTTQQQALDHARALADAGVPIFCARPDPDGRTKSGRQTGFMLPRAWETTKPNARYVDAWQPGMALCAVMGRVLDLIDFDPQNAEDGVIDKLKAVGVPFTYGYVETPSGGWHAYIKAMGVASHDAILPGIDIKAGHQGEGHGFAFLPPTQRPSKVTGEIREYTWYMPPDLSFLPSDEGEPAFAEFAKGQRKPAASEFIDPHTSTVDVMGTINVGERDNALTRYAARLRSLGISFEEARRLLEYRWRECEQPGGNRFEWIDALGKLESAWRNIEPNAREPNTTEDESNSLIPAAIDWRELWDDETEEEWIVEPLLAARRLVALYSEPKIGKSLISLELAAAISCGFAVLGSKPKRSYRVLYVDFENDPRGDIRERLKAMNYQPDDLGNLCYLSFPSLAALDSNYGGELLMRTIEHYGCEVVIIDTVSRSVAGEENANDTWLAFYRMTGLRLKRAGVALLRLDHAGKDPTKGQRGGSAKLGDVDVVWRLGVVTETTLRLDCEAMRMPIPREMQTMTLHRETDPLRHRVDAKGWRGAIGSKIDQLVDMLKEADFPLDAGLRKAKKIKEARAAEDSTYRASDENLKRAIDQYRRMRGASAYAFDEDTENVGADDAHTSPDA